MTELPPWAVVGPAPCLTAACSGCRDPFGDEESGGHWHFADVAELIKAIADYDADGDDAPWRIVGDELLCARCVVERVCAERGHRWEHHQAAEAVDHGSWLSLAHPEFWTCTRCRKGSKTDPTLPVLTVVGGEPS